MIRRSFLFAGAAAALLAPQVASVGAAWAQQPVERRQVGALTLENVPVTPPEVRERLRRYQNARSAGFQSWLDDGSMLITTRFGQTAQLHRVAAPGGDRTQLTFFDEPIAGAEGVPGSRDRFIFSKDTGGDEYFQGYMAGLTGPEVAFTEPGTRNQAMTFSKDGRRLAWARVGKGDPDYDIVVMDVDNPASRRKVLDATGATAPLAFSPDGKTLLLERFISATSSKLLLLDVATGQVTPLNPSATDIAYGTAEFTADGKAVLALSDEGSDFKRLVSIDLATGRSTPVSPPDLTWDVEEFDLSDDGRLLAYSVNEGGRSRVVVQGFRTKQAVRQPKLPVGVLAALKFSPDGKRLAIGLNTATAPADVWSFDPASGALTRWTYSEAGGLDLSALREPELISFKSFDGLTVPAWVYKPAKINGRAPVVIDIHGGPEGQDRPGFNTRRQYWAAELGAVTIAPNVRGSDGYGKKYIQLDNGPLRQDSVKDIGALLDWIATQPDLDKDRVVVYGGSYGGFMVLASLAAYNDRLAGAIDIVGISNFKTFLQNTEGYRRDLRRAEYGDERDPKMAAVFDQISPLNLTSKMNRPLFVIQGRNDPRVPWTEAEQIVAAVRKQGGEVWYMLAGDEGHGFRKKQNTDAQREAETLFLQKVFAK
ncbi:MAG TPA: prolyl oligopeptidase family serine peptidase [Caulobacter sp.]|nr:prolyl oligopeptidase family serine peptidase [Caulobacter sp.]